MREGQTGVSRETFERETGQTGGSGGQVRQVGLWSGSQAVQARSGGQVSGETGETGTQAVQWLRCAT